MNGLIINLCFLSRCAKQRKKNEESYSKNTQEKKIIPLITAQFLF